MVECTIRNTSFKGTLMDILVILGHINIDDDDVPRDKEVAAKENEAIFDSLSPCRAYSWPNLSNDFMAQQRWLNTLQDFVI